MLVKMAYGKWLLSNKSYLIIGFTSLFDKGNGTDLI